MSALVAQGAASASDNAPPPAIATRIDGTIRLDGRLDEPHWASAPVIGPLVQSEPKEGGAASEETEVRVLFDSDQLYFGILCRDRTPKAIVRTQLRRDAELDVDDRITLVLDPFLDHRNGFFFEVNPAGARADGQISNNSESRSYEWDGIWDARARVTEEGWVAELAIPWKTLRFRTSAGTWGLNVERSIKRLQEIDRWASPRRDVWITNVAQAGVLAGLEGVRQGRGLDIRPYVSAGEQQGDGEWRAGLDVFKSLTPSLTASVTVHTDFAETEADARQVNLTRFPLFFPEKRTFFLEGAGVYDVAGLGSRNEDLIPFFSRRIGLYRGQEVEILAGAKVTGREGGWNVGLLDVLTRRSDDLALDRQNLLAARVSRNFLEQSWVGAILTHGDPSGAGSNTLVGADLRLATSRFHGGKNLSLDLYAFRTDDAASATADYAFGGKLDFPNDLLDVALSFKQIGGDFRAALGFVPRPGIRKTSLGIEYMPRPERLGIRQLFFELRPEYITNLAGRVENWEIFTAPLNVRTESGEQFEWSYTPQFEHLAEPFEIEDGIVVPAGSYTVHRYRAEVSTASKRPWVVDLEYGWGGFYTGTLRQIEAGVTLKPSTHVSLEIQAERNDVRLPQGSFRTDTWSVRLDWSFSPNVTWANLVQYDTESRLLGVQSRFRLILRPGNDLFVVFNRGFERREDGGAYVPRFDKGSLKFQYTFRL